MEGTRRFYFSRHIALKWHHGESKSLTAITTRFWHSELIARKQVDYKYNQQGKKLNDINPAFRMNKDTNATIFRDLAVLTEAGISVADAARRIVAPNLNKSVWEGVVRLLERGRTLSVSLGKSGLISRDEQEIISISEFAGRLPQGLRHIAQTYELRNRRVARIKSQLSLPLAVLLIGLVISVILALVNSPHISAFIVIGKSIFLIGIVLIITRFLLKILQKDTFFWLKIFHQFENKNWYQCHFEQVLGSVLVWHIRSGIDFKTAFMKIASLVDYPAINAKLKRTSFYCGQGMAVTESVIRAGLPITKAFLQVSRTGESSGCWEDVIEKYLEQQAILLKVQLDSIFDWIPRVYYLIVIFIVIPMVF